MNYINHNCIIVISALRQSSSTVEIPKMSGCLCEDLHNELYIGPEPALLVLTHGCEIGN